MNWEQHLTNNNNNRELSLASDKDMNFMIRHCKLACRWTVINIVPLIEPMGSAPLIEPMGSAPLIEPMGSAPLNEPIGAPARKRVFRVQLLLAAIYKTNACSNFLR